MEGRDRRWREAIRGGGEPERSQVGGSDCRLKGAISGGGERSQVEGAIAGAGVQSQAKGRGRSSVSASA